MVIICAVDFSILGITSWTFFMGGPRNSVYGLNLIEENFEFQTSHAHRNKKCFISSSTNIYI